MATGQLEGSEIDYKGFNIAWDSRWGPTDMFEHIWYEWTRLETCYLVHRLILRKNTIGTWERSHLVLQMISYRNDWDESTLELGRTKGKNLRIWRTWDAVMAWKNHGPGKKGENSQKSVSENNYPLLFPGPHRRNIRWYDELLNGHSRAPYLDQVSPRPHSGASVSKTKLISIFIGHS